MKEMRKNSGREEPPKKVTFFEGCLLCICSSTLMITLGDRAPDVTKVLCFLLISASHQGPSSSKRKADRLVEWSL